jgi:hypothetical protein
MDENTAGPAADRNAENVAGPAATPEMAELEADIARTRAELAATVDQLTAKLDVKTRVRHRVTEAKDAATVQVQSARRRLVGSDGKPRPSVLGVGGGVLAAVAAVVLVKLWQRPARRRRRRSPRVGRR